MAGIGFVLRKLAEQDNLTGLFRAYFHSAMASSGPWLLTVISLGLLTILGQQVSTQTEQLEFRLVIIYCFAFSLVLTGALTVTLTRYLADAIYQEDVRGAPGALLGSLLIISGICLPFSVGLFFWYADLDTFTAVNAVFAFMLISYVWVVGVFLTALKDYKTITNAFLVGMLTAVVGGLIGASAAGTGGTLAGFNLGLTIILSALLARIFAEYPYRPQRLFEFTAAFRKYWELALSGLIYNLAIWVDKWIMWFAPERLKASSNLISYPNYDAAMFLAYLTIVPAMSFFLLSIETDFYREYIRFYRDVQNHATFDRIKRNHKSILTVVFDSSRNFVVIQICLSLGTILLSPRLFQWLGINYLQLGVFRYGVLGAFFHVLTIMLTILLSYFDNRLLILRLQLVFLVCNAAFTLLFLQFGFAFYGYGYFLATLTTFILTAFVTARSLELVPYHTFITNNPSVKETI